MNRKITMRLLFFFGSFIIAVSAYTQPDEWYVTIIPNEVDYFLANKRTIDLCKVDSSDKPIVDGVKDAIWDKVDPIIFDRYNWYQNASDYTHFSRVTLPGIGRRFPDSKDDFSGSFRVLYDANNIYCFYDITDNEVNDNNVNPLVFEEAEFQIAPYADSAQELLNGKPYPPYSGKAGELNKKFCYWAYLGAFKINFPIDKNGQCGNIYFREKLNAQAKINYQERLTGCKCAWSLKTDYTGYLMEISISLKNTLSDSANKPFPIPQSLNDMKRIAFETKIFDRDREKYDVQAAWNSENCDVWDAMLYSGKATMRGWTVGTKVINDEDLTFLPNPATTFIRMNRTVSKIDVISINGIVVKSGQNTRELNISDLVSGIYLVRMDGIIAGKFIKD